MKRFIPALFFLWIGCFSASADPLPVRDPDGLLAQVDALYPVRTFEEAFQPGDEIEGYSVSAVNGYSKVPRTVSVESVSIDSAILKFKVGIVERLYTQTRVDHDSHGGNALRRILADLFAPRFSPNSDEWIAVQKVTPVLIPITWAAISTPPIKKTIDALEVELLVRKLDGNGRNPKELRTAYTFAGGLPSIASILKVKFIQATAAEPLIPPGSDARLILPTHPADPEQGVWITRVYRK